MSADPATARANGAKSRGPKTARGKAISKMNATKHGLVARVGVLLADESAADYDALGESLRHELAPVGALEHEIVARIVDALWRLRRVARLEAGALTMLRAKRLGESVTKPFEAGSFEADLPGFTRERRTTSARRACALAIEADKALDTSGARWADGYISGAERGAWDSLVRHGAGLERSLVVMLRTLEGVQARRESRPPGRLAERTDERSLEPGSRGGLP